MGWGGDTVKEQMGKLQCTYTKPTSLSLHIDGFISVTKFESAH